MKFKLCNVLLVLVLELLLSNCYNNNFKSLHNNDVINNKNSSRNSKIVIIFIGLGLCIMLGTLMLIIVKYLKTIKKKTSNKTPISCITKEDNNHKELLV